MVNEEYELNLPRIASQSILGLNRRRLGIVKTFPLHSTCTIFLCYTEQLSSTHISDTPPCTQDSRYPPLQRSLKICTTPFLLAYSSILAPLNFCIECRRYRAKRRCDTEDSSRATASVSQQGLYDRYGAICKKKRSKSFDLLL